MVKATFVIPKADNDGKLFPTKLIAQLQIEIINLFGGYTVREANGAWKGDDGKIYYDASWMFEVSIKKDQVAALVNWLKQAKVTLRQEAMYLEITEANVSFI